VRVGDGRLGEALGFVHRMMRRCRRANDWPTHRSALNAAIPDANSEALLHRSKPDLNSVVAPTKEEVEGMEERKRVFAVMVKRFSGGTSEKDEDPKCLYDAPDGDNVMSLRAGTEAWVGHMSSANLFCQGFVIGYKVKQPTGEFIKYRLDWDEKKLLHINLTIGWLRKGAGLKMKFAIVCDDRCTLFKAVHPAPPTTPSSSTSSSVSGADEMSSPGVSSSPSAPARMALATSPTSSNPTASAAEGASDSAAAGPTPHPSTVLVKYKFWVKSTMLYLQQCDPLCDRLVSMR
jgi:hypothetical protein